MKGDREMSRKAGMDGYTSKPADRTTLLKLAERPQVSPASKGSESTATPAEPAAGIEFDELIERLGGDRTLLQSMAALFAEEGPRMMAVVAEAVRTGTDDDLRQAAHALRGAVGNFSREGAMATAARIEALATAGTRDAIQVETTLLGEQIAAMVSSLQEFALRRVS
jgi:HPt (histidine-containing phosphotransfer) domain-containing protein